MPYIKKDSRELLDQQINNLAGHIFLGAKEPEEIYGMLNYAITRLILRTFQLRIGKVRYHVIATITGMLDNIKHEFTRRIYDPYETTVCLKNGDISEFNEIYESILDNK